MSDQGLADARLFLGSVARAGRPAAGPSNLTEGLFCQPQAPWRGVLREFGQLRPIEDNKRAILNFGRSACAEHLESLGDMHPRDASVREIAALQ